MQMMFGTEAVEVTTDAYPDLGAGGQTVVIQNLGPGDLYVDFDAAVTSSTGLKVGSGDAYEFRRAKNQALYAVATEASTDVRVLVVD